jgi:CBS domain-containing protein
MLRRPKLLPSGASVDDVRAQFGDDHVHLVLVTSEDGVLLTTIERTDLDGATGALAQQIGTLNERVISGDASIEEALNRMTADARRRLAVIDEEGRLLGLLCLKQSGNGFCSDGDVDSRSGEYA